MIEATRCRDSDRLAPRSDPSLGPVPDTRIAWHGLCQLSDFAIVGPVSMNTESRADGASLLEPYLERRAQGNADVRRVFRHPKFKTEIDSIAFGQAITHAEIE